MENTKHTPGPWKIETTPRENGSYWIKANDGHVATVGHVDEQPNALFDAQLIARAPEMAAEIERLKQDVHDHKMIGKVAIADGMKCRDEISRLKALLKRAGETLRWVMNSPRDANVVTSALLLLTDIQKEGL